MTSSDWVRVVWIDGRDRRWRLAGWSGLSRLGGFCAGEEVVGFGGGEPVAVFGDADGDDVVLFAVDGVEDGGGGEEGDFVLAGAAAEENADA